VLPLAGAASARAVATRGAVALASTVALPVAVARRPTVKAAAKATAALLSAEPVGAAAGLPDGEVWRLTLLGRRLPIGARQLRANQLAVHRAFFAARRRGVSEQRVLVVDPGRAVTATPRAVHAEERPDARHFVVDRRRQRGRALLESHGARCVSSDHR
jgi:hypothetical protein